MIIIFDLEDKIIIINVCVCSLGRHLQYVPLNRHVELCQVDADVHPWAVLLISADPKVT